MLENLKSLAAGLGKDCWRPTLVYMAGLHERNTNPPRGPLKLPWEGLGPGYVYAPAFGHWDIVHATLDVMSAEPEHARNQIVNNLATQSPQGQFAHIVWWRPDERIEMKASHPPVWPAAVDAFYELTGDRGIIELCYEPLVRQIGWWERNRRAEEGGFYYLDILDRIFESGVDLGARFEELLPEPRTCVDATAHLYWLYDHAARWAAMLGHDAAGFLAQAGELKAFIQRRLFDEQTGLFHDIWSVNRPEARILAFEGIWPVVVGAATAEQARRVIEENIMNPRRFLALHPIPTIALEDGHYQPRMWRGPAWNSMTYWAARGCLRYGRGDAAKELLGRALDATAAQFDRTGTIWEFYDPHGGPPEELKRKPNRDLPSTDYVGHNPLLAMARMWEAL